MIDEKDEQIADEGQDKGKTSSFLFLFPKLFLRQRFEEAS
jgi:hypothetical protein